MIVERTAAVAFQARMPKFSFQRTLCGVLAGALAFGSFSAAAQVRLPSLGEAASADLSVGDEKRIGEAIMREARRDPAFLDDPVLQEYLMTVWTPLLEAARRTGQVDAEIDRLFSWEAFLVKDRSVNAFALPGGYVGAHLGLIAITQTTDQFASVMAHELTHVTQRHIARGVAPQQQAGLWAIAGFLLAILAASRGGAGSIDAANAAMMGGQGAGVQAQLNFSRDVEREADRIGYAVLGAAGFAPAGMAAMFDRLDYASRLNDNNSYPYLRSHPLTSDRISEARNRTLLSPGRASVPTLQHALMQMRSRVLMDDNPQALQRFKGETSSPSAIDKAAALYGGALAASMLRDGGRALALAQQAVAASAAISPREPLAERWATLLQGQVLLGRGGPGDAAAALALLEQVPTAANASPRPVLLMRAQAALVMRQSDAAAATGPLRSNTEALQTWVAEQPHDAAAWELLALSSDALGLKLRSMRAAAESRVVLGDLNGAIDRLRAAQAQSRGATGADFIEASVIDTRLRQVTALRRQLALEARGERGGRSGPQGDEPPPQ